MECVWSYVVQECWSPVHRLDLVGLVFLVVHAERGRVCLGSCGTVEGSSDSVKMILKVVVQVPLSLASERPSLGMAVVAGILALPPQDVAAVILVVVSAVLQ